MRTTVASLAAAAVLACSSAVAAAPPAAPVAKQIPVSDTYFGTTVVDPYRWMEAKGPDLLAYLKAYDDRTRALLDAIPGRAALVTRLQGLADASSSASGVVSHRGTLFYQKTPTGADSARLYVRDANGDRVLLDPATLAGPRQAISYFTPSGDGTRVAVGLASGGSENGTVHVVDVAGGRLLPDSADRADFGVTSWSDDGRAFYYLRRQAVPAGAPPVAKYLNVRTFRHVVGQPASSDVAVFGAGVDPSADIPATSFGALAVSPESPYVAGVAINGVDRFTTVYVAPKAALAGDPAAIPWRRVIAPADRVTEAALHGTTLYLLTAKDAPRYRLVKLDIKALAAAAPATAAMAAAADVIPAGSRVLDAVAAASDAVYVRARENGIGRIVRVGYDGSARDIRLPVEGTVAGLATEYDRPGFVVRLESWTSSPLWYRYDPAADTLTDTKLDAPSPADYGGIVADELTAPAPDGTAIPLSIVHRRDIKLDGSNPTLLYAYGSYGISTEPNFSAARLAWLERGGILAYAHVRGGGEFGEEWHLAGKGPNKVNTVSDFNACARWLIAKGYTAPAKLGARGGSAGGITMGGAITRAPELYAAVLDEIPVSDQLRIETTPNGPPNVPEFGTVTSAEGFANLYATSPVHHVVTGTRYPAVMLTTGINDPRVDPWQAAKMAATLQAATTSGKPILLRVDYEGGHGLIGGTKSQGVALAADEYSFLLWQFGTAGFQPAVARR